MWYGGGSEAIFERYRGYRNPELDLEKGGWKKGESYEKEKTRRALVTVTRAPRGAVLER